MFFETGATLCRNIYVIQKALEKKKMLLVLNRRNCFKGWGNLETVSRGWGNLETVSRGWDNLETVSRGGST